VRNKDAEGGAMHPIECEDGVKARGDALRVESGKGQVGCESVVGLGEGSTRQRRGTTQNERTYAQTTRGRRPREQCSQLWIQYTMYDDGFCSSACNEKETRDDDDEEQPAVRAGRETSRRERLSRTGRLSKLDAQCPEQPEER
jgi:hypothetical protein